MHIDSLMIKVVDYFWLETVCSSYLLVDRLARELGVVLMETYLKRLQDFLKAIVAILVESE